MYTLTTCKYIEFKKGQSKKREKNKTTYIYKLNLQIECRKKIYIKIKYYKKVG